MIPPTLDDLIEIEDRFQSHLTFLEYSVIAPVDKTEFDRFLELSEKYFPVSTVHHFLSDRTQVRALLRALPSNVRLAVYVLKKSDKNADARIDLASYIIKNKIDFRI